MFQILLIKLQELSMAWKPSVIVVLPENLTWCYLGNSDCPAHIAYAAPAWWGFVSLAERDQIQSVIKKAQRCGYLPRNFPDVSCLVDAPETN